MNDVANDRPIVAVLSAGDAAPWPGLEPLENEAVLRRTTDGEQLKEAIGDADVLLVTNFRSSEVEEAWPYAEQLKWVHATSAGVDRLMFDELVQSDVPLTNAKGIFDRPIAEYVLGLVLHFAKDFGGTLAYQRQRQWQHRDSERIEGKRALVVGAGGIGRQVARLLGAAGMEVSGLASRRREGDADFGTIHASADLNDLLPEQDYVVIAAPLTSQTRHMFAAEQFRLMKESARLINIGRGPIVETESLVEALRSGALAGAGLDVFEQEPLPADHPLWVMPNVVVSPHMAGDVVGWREALSRQFIENFRRWRRGEQLKNVVDKRRGYVPGAKE